ncbi:MAG: hypothetical protein ACLRWQ_16480 [Flavonifractor plautii]
MAGHWPVTLYDPASSAAPIIDRARHIISIDGGCVLQAGRSAQRPYHPGGVLSGLQLDRLRRAGHGPGPGPTGAFGGFLNIRWGRNRVEVPEQGPELSLCRHPETGTVCPILTSCLYDSPEAPVQRLH